MINAMAEGDQQTKAERKQAREQSGAGEEAPTGRRQGRAGGQARAGRRQARAGGQRAERRKPRGGRRRGGRAAAEADAAGADESLAERIESRLTNLEEAVAAQSQRSEELLEKVDAMLSEASGSEGKAD
jgi:hypothetical protein